MKMIALVKHDVNIRQAVVESSGVSIRAEQDKRHIGDVNGIPRFSLTTKAPLVQIGESSLSVDASRHYIARLIEDAAAVGDIHYIVSREAGASLIKYFGRHIATFFSAVGDTSLLDNGRRVADSLIEIGTGE